MVGCGKLSPVPHCQGSHNSVSIMQEFQISIGGIIKLLSNLKTGKDAGPDKIRPLILKELRNEIALIIMVIFERSVETGKLPTDIPYLYPLQGP